MSTWHTWNALITMHPAPGNANAEPRKFGTVRGRNQEEAERYAWRLARRYGFHGGVEVRRLESDR